MLSEKQFRERAKTELRQIGEQLQCLARDRDVYWKMERDIIQRNPQLQAVRSPLVDMLRGCYADAMAARILRLLDGGPSLPEVLTKMAQHQQIMDDKITEREFADDRAALQQAFVNVQRAMVPHSAHHERTLPALATLNRELDTALDLMIDTAKTYYWIIADSHIDVEVRYCGDPMSVFDFAWAVPVLAK
jgi:hypothetical protein